MFRRRRAASVLDRPLLAQVDALARALLEVAEQQPDERDEPQEQPDHGA